MECFSECNIVFFKALEKDGFGERPLYYCLVAVDQSANTEGRARKLVGYALYHLNFTWEGCTAYMEDLYVSPSYRAKKIGTTLWTNLLQDAMSAGANACIFSVLNWNAPSLDFYKSKGAENLTASKGYRTFRIRGGAASRLAALELPYGLDKISLAAAQDFGEGSVVVKEAKHEYIPSVMMAYAAMAEEAGRVPEMNITQGELSRGLCSASPWCYLLVAKSPSEELLGFLLYCLAYSTWEGVQLYIKDLFVWPHHRRGGVGSALMRALLRKGKTLGSSRCDFVLASGQNAALQFFRTHGAVDLSAKEGWVHMRLQRTQMEAIVTS